ncbi:MAG: endonuclease domain-containing protein [Bdellovibrionales bacterium]
MPEADHKNRDPIIHRAKNLRQSASMVERLLWRELRSDPRQKELKFRFQHPLSFYVVDFVCLSARLVVEIDGMSHDSTEEEDKKRQNHIEKLGYSVLRFANQEVLKDVSCVAEQIRLAAQDRWETGQRVNNPNKKSQAHHPPLAGGSKKL